jgi:hypothetical protein
LTEGEKTIAVRSLERFPVQVTRKAIQSYRVVAFSDGKPVTTFPENALAFGGQNDDLGSYGGAHVEVDHVLIDHANAA